MKKTNIFKNKVILVTGGTGSFGRKFAEIILKEYLPKKVIIFSRDELKQFEMAQEYAKYNAKIRYFIGDVRDKERLLRAFNGVDYVIHAAALKQVPAMEYNPCEAVKTNVIGAMNLIEAAINSGIKKVIALSTDKACSPINLYGATKLCSDKLVVAANSYSGGKATRFAVVRYGNVINSRGSVVPFFREKEKEGVLPITDERMTRFLISLEQGVRFVIRCFNLMHGGEIFVPKIPSVKITDLAKAIAPDCKTKNIGIRPGEKIHEKMISSDDARNTKEFDDYYVINPTFNWWEENNYSEGKSVPQDFYYGSDTNRNWLTISQLKKILKD